MGWLVEGLLTCIMLLNYNFDNAFDFVGNVCVQIALRVVQTWTLELRVQWQPLWTADMHNV